MSANTLRALVLTGDGINCEVETAEALRLAGFEPEIRHLNDLIREKLTLDALSLGYAVLALPGGFSFGDDLESGKVLALKIRHGLSWDLHEYADRGGLVIGICNGFQALIKMGTFGKDVSITHNAQGRFVNTWVRATPQRSRSLWLKGAGTMELPARHGEGRIVFPVKNRASVLSKLERQGMICLRYEGDPNGSEERIAGLCDPTGRILGLMPHPEAAVRGTAHPSWTGQPDGAGARGDGMQVFENAARAAREAR
ncbi:MAG: phosphoribosylformylglycinamidine synthase subunit PurQ [Bdellovibrionales bacterium]|nr:phosphoribosylformylglycinamidine synthase subunit PurQ [Bdellovibrionales bacterium]